MRGNPANGGPTPDPGPEDDDTAEVGTIVVGVDGSEHSRLAVKWACDEADRRGALLRLIFAETSEPEHLPPWYEPGQTVESAGQAVVDDAFGLVVMRHPSVVARAEVVKWPPAMVLTVASRSAELLVVGARGRGGFKELLLGSVSDQCIQYSHCPVVVVSDDPESVREPEGGPRIVVGIDGSFGSAQALRWALDEARVRSAVVEALYVWQYPPIGAFVLGPPKGFEAFGQEIIDGARAFQNRWAPDVPFEVAAHMGPTVPSLLDHSRGADLLVLGSRGHGSFGDVLLGSVTHQCARHAHGAVIVTRPPVTAASSWPKESSDRDTEGSVIQVRSETSVSPPAGDVR
jgi:nucleotide-binding universal stress UspA family protein